MGTTNLGTTGTIPENSTGLRTEKVRKKPWKHCISRAFWRRRWDSNPRALAGYLISSQGRYDHFDTPPCITIHFLTQIHLISSQPRYDHFDTAAQLI